MHWIYERYPMLTPHVGCNYIPGGERSILLIGESHYLPRYSNQHETAARWYSSDSSTLNDEERFWINTSHWAYSGEDDVKHYFVRANGETAHNDPQEPDWPPGAQDYLSCGFRIPIRP